MASVTIRRPGQRTIDDASGQSGWTFTAEVDGQVGIISEYSESDLSEDDAAESAKLMLEKDPSLLGGIV